MLIMEVKKRLNKLESQAISDTELQKTVKSYMKVQKTMWRNTE